MSVIGWSFNKWVFWVHIGMLDKHIEMDFYSTALSSLIQLSTGRNVTQFEYNTLFSLLNVACLVEKWQIQIL